MKHTCSRKWKTRSSITTALCFAALAATDLAAQPSRPRPPRAADPGVRGGAADSGTVIPGLTTDELNAFVIAEETFNAVDSINGDIPGEDDEGLALFSDLALRNMGSGLRDDVSQGGAGPDEFRTAPLWGLGQRIFFLHDGRSTDLVAAIQAHASTGSEANTVVQNYHNLSNSQRQDLLNFLRSL